MRLTLLLLAGLISARLAAQTVLFQQDFSASTAVTSYVSGTPNAGQFTSLANTGTNSSVSIVGNALQMASGAGPGQVAYFNRTNGFTSPGNPAALLVQFDFEVTNPGASGTNQATFYLGSGFPDNGAVSVPNVDVYARLGFNFQAGQPAFEVRDISGNQNSTLFNGRQRISIFTNNSGSTLGYIGPNRSLQTLANDRYDVWVGNTRVFANLPALTPGQIQNQMRFIFQNNNTTIQLDNFLITDDLNLLPVHLQHFTGQLVGLQPELTWAAVNLTPGTSFAIERSATGQAPFAEIGQLAVPAGASSAFAWTDRQPLPGTNYYRLALRLPGQAPTYSRVVAVAPVAVFAPQLGPNPATDLVTLSTLGDGPGQWQLFDNQGHLLATVPWSATRPVIRWSVEHLRPGLYVWQARNQQGQSSQGRLVKR